MNKLSLTAKARTLLDQARTAPAGRAAEAVYGGHEKTLRQTVIALRAGTALAEHDSPGEATVHVLVGRVRLVAGEAAWEGAAGDLLVVPETRHGLEAMVDSAVVLTVAKGV